MKDKEVVMASTKSLLFVSILVSVVAAQPARAQLFGLGEVHINGTVFCSVTPPLATTPVFPNAAVGLQCGNNVISKTTTNADGIFGMTLSLIPSLLSSFLNDCKLVVTTPLSSCDISLPSIGMLQSVLHLQNLGSLLGPILGGVFNVVPTAFSFIN